MFNGVEIEIIPQEIERLRKRDLVHYCRECKAYHPVESLYACKHIGQVDGEQLYWNNQIGWVDISHAAFYSFEETEKYICAVPRGWEQILCA